MAHPTMPTLTMVEERLKSFCERTGTKLPPSLPKEIKEKRIDLNWATGPLPINWRQHLDFKTGDFYWTNSLTGERFTTKDPQKFILGCYYCDESYDDGYDTTIGSTDENVEENSSEITYETPPETVKFLVVSACKTCLTYIMVAEGTTACPKCGGRLLHIGQEDMRF